MNRCFPDNISELKTLVTILITLLLSFGSRLSGSTADVRNCISSFSCNPRSDNATYKILENKYKSLSIIDLQRSEETDTNLPTWEDNAATESPVVVMNNAAIVLTILETNVTCFGNSNGAIDLTVSGGIPAYTYLWTASAGGVIPAGQANGQDLSGLTAGIYDLMVTDSHGAFASITLTIAQPAALSAGSISTNSPVCQGSSLILNVTATGGTPSYSYAWTGPNGFTSTISSPIVSNALPAASGTYSVTVTDVNGCTASSSTVVTVNTTPSVNNPSDQTVCSGASTSGITYTGTGTSYTWINNNTSIGLAASGTGDIASFTATNSGIAQVVATITVTPHFTNGGITCDGLAKTFTITVKPSPALTATPASQSFCSGGTTSVSLTGTVTGTSFAWTTAISPAGSISGAADGTGNNIFQTLTNSTQLQAIVTYTVIPSVNSCSGNSVDVPVTVYPIPNLSSPLSANVCSSSLFSYTPTSDASGTTFSWTRAAVLGIQNVAASGTGAVNETLINNTGSAKTVTYVYTLTANGCTHVQNVTITVLPLSMLLSSISPPAVCSNTSFNYVAVSSISGTAMTWVRSVNAGISNPAGSGTGNITETLINTTASDVVVSYVYTLSLAGCANTFTVNATIKPTPVLSGTLTPAAICSNTIFSYEPASLTTGTTFSWSRNPVAGISNGPASGTGNPNETLINTTHNPLNVTYVYILRANGCPHTQNVVVTVNPVPEVDNLVNEEFCNGETTSLLSLTGPVSGSTFTWANNNTAIGLASNGSGNIPSFVATNSTNAPISASITVTPSANGCSGTPLTFLISVNPTPSANIPVNQVVCNGAASTAINFTGTFATITWTNNHPEIGLAASGSGDIGTFTCLNAGSNPIVATITVTPHFSLSGPGCDGIPTSFTITVNPIPAVNAITSQTLCSGASHASILFSTSATGGSPTFNWTSSNDVGFGTSGSGMIPSFTATNAGLTPITATVNVTASMNGCTGAVTSFTITINPAPTVNQPTNQAVCNNGLTTAIHFTGTATSFAWTNSNNTIGINGSGTGDIGAFTAINIGVIPVIATITVTPIYTNGGTTCSSSPKSFNITVNPSPAATITGTTSVCQNASAPLVTFTGSNGTAPYTFTYKINGGSDQVITTIAGNNISISAPTGVTGTFIYSLVNVSATTGCSNLQSGTATITVVTPPAATISGSTTVCQNAAAPNITFTGANGTAPYTFTYKINGGSDLVVTTISGNSVTVGAPTNAAGTFVYSMVSVSSSAGCSLALSGTATVTVNPTPNLVINNPANICSPATANLTSAAITAGSTAGLTFSYWTNAGATIPFGSPASAGSGTYYIKGTNTATSCFDIKPVTVTVSAAAALVITNPSPVCAPGTVNLTLPAVTAGSTAGLTYTYWTNAAATSVHSTPATSDDATYYIKGTSASGCFDIKPVVASVYATLGIPVFTLGASSVICKGSAPITYTATVINAFTLTYSLDAASLAAGNTINSTTGRVTFASGWTGTSQITATATGCGAPATAIHSVTINPTPTVTLVASPATPVCEGASITLTATNSGGSAQQTYSGTSGTINLAIPDNSNGSYAYPTITLSGSSGATLTSSDVVIVTLNINHVHDSDLDIFLVDPSGTRAMLLSSDNGSSNDNYVNTVIRTDAVNPITSGSFPFTGTYLPQGSITTAPDRSGAAGGGNYNAVIPASALNGSSVDGAWSLRVFDDGHSGEYGSIANWSLSILKQSGGLFTTVVNGPQTIGTVTYSGANHTTATSVVTPPAGTNSYTVTTTDGNGCSATSAPVTVVVNAKPTPVITADYCIIRPIVRLSTGAYSTYLWNTGATTQVLDVDIAGKYTVTVTDANGCQGTTSIQVADELVVNGDFSAGNVGFTTGYGYRADVGGNTELSSGGAGGGGEGLYGVGVSGRNYHTNFWGYDHTSNNGTQNFMIVNGWGSTYTVWEETNVPITPNTDYYFAAWAMSLNNIAICAKLRFEVNGVQVGSTANLVAGVNSNANPWRPQDRFYGMWNSGSATTATIRIINLEPTLNGNDFGLDDISFGTLASIPFTVTASNNSPICSRSTLQLTSTTSGGKPPIVYSWTGPNGFTSSNANPTIPNISPTVGGVYTVSVTDAYNCPPVVSTTTVTLNPTPEIPNQSALICSGSTFTATPANGVPDANTFIPAGTTFSWPAPTVSPLGSVTGSSAQSSQTIISQTLTNTSNSSATVTYVVTPIKGGCTGNTFNVVVTVNAVATSNAGSAQQICAGNTAQLNGYVGGSATSGTWSGGTGTFTPNSNTLNAVYHPSAADITAGSVTLSLMTNDPDGAGPCPAVSSTVIITINALPVLTSTHVNVNCHGSSTGSIDLSVSGGTPGYTYTWTASNGGVIPSGQANQQDLTSLVAGTYTVAVSDTKTCGANLSVTLTESAVLAAHESHPTVPCAGGSSSVIITATGGTTPYSGTGTFSQLQGTTTYTVTDAHGCASNVVVIVTVDANSAPVITTCPVARNFNGCSPAAISGPLFSNIDATSSYAEFSDANNQGLASDNCAITAVTYKDVAIYACPISVTRTWKLFDASGLNTTCQQIIHVSDINAPTWTTALGALARTVECSDAPGLASAMALFPVASDNCDADVSNIVKTTGLFVPSSGCAQNGTYTNSWTVTDECGNVSSPYIQVITITDNTPPAWTTAAGSLNRTMECSNSAALAAAQALKPVASDNCDLNVANIVKAAGAFVPGSCGNQGTYTNTWTVADDCGNISSTFVQVITTTDTTSPVWLTAPGVLNETVECSNAGNLAAAQAMHPIAWDNCDVDVSNLIKISGTFVPSTVCQQEGTYTNTWTVTDDCGNTSPVFTQVITIEDNIGPMIYCPSSDAFSCATPLDPSVTGMAVATSDCDPNPVLTWTDVIIPGLCGGNYQIIRTWKASDACGNFNTCQQTIFVQDVNPPVITCPFTGNQTVDHNSPTSYIHPDNSWNATAIDDCSGVTLTASLTGATNSGPVASLNGVTFNDGITTVTWTASDGCGNTISCQFTITVRHALIITCPPGILRNTDIGVCNATFDPGFPTKVSGVEPISFSWVMTGVTTGSGTGAIGTTTFNIGITTITWTATNISGTAVCTQLITVADHNKPTFAIPAAFSACVEILNSAIYNSATQDINPNRPEYYVFVAGNNALDLNVLSFNDNCPLSCAVEIRWKIDMNNATRIPSLPTQYHTGQPSTFGSDIQFLGDGINFTSVIHTITYWIVDCAGNVSDPKTQTITIKPRPNITKLN